MKVLMTVLDKDGNLIKQSILDSGHAMVDGLLEIKAGNAIAMSEWIGGEAHLPEGFIFDLRLQRTIN